MFFLVHSVSAFFSFGMLLKLEAIEMKGYMHLIFFVALTCPAVLCKGHWDTVIGIGTTRTCTLVSPPQSHTIVRLCSCGVFHSSVQDWAVHISLCIR